MKFVALLTCLLPLSLAAQSPTADTPLLKGVTGAFFALSVADLDASARWYGEKFGMKVTLDVPPNGGTSVRVLEGGGLTVELVRHASASQPAKPPTEALGPFKVGLVVEQFDETVAALRARGVAPAYGPFPATPTQRANVIIRDNAGTLIQLFARR